VLRPYVLWRIIPNLLTNRPLEGLAANTKSLFHRMRIAFNACRIRFVTLPIKTLFLTASRVFRGYLHPGTLWLRDGPLLTDNLRIPERTS
jgi:hypothetical protein